MTEKRKLSTRNRGEPPLKKRESTPLPPPPPPPPPPQVVPVEEGLPVKLKDGQPLPILPEQQVVDLSISDFQTISERFVHRINQSKMNLADLSPQWCVSGSIRTLASEMAFRRHLRKILGKTIKEESPS